MVEVHFCETARRRQYGIRSHGAARYGSERRALEALPGAQKHVYRRNYLQHCPSEAATAATAAAAAAAVAAATADVDVGSEADTRSIRRFVDQLWAHRPAGKTQATPCFRRGDAQSCSIRSVPDGERICFAVSSRLGSDSFPSFVCETSTPRHQRCDNTDGRPSEAWGAPRQKMSMTTMSSTTTSSSCCQSAKPLACCLSLVFH